MALGRAGRADERSVREFQVKAAFLFHFAQFVEWPADAFPRGDSPLVIGVVGRGDPFNGGAERAVRDKKVGDHPIVIAHYDMPRRWGRATSCSSATTRPIPSMPSFKRPAAGH